MFYLSFAESTHDVDGPGLWRLTLDQDLLDTLSRRFPTWFDSGCSGGSSSSNSSSSGGSNTSNSPPPNSDNSTSSGGSSGVGGGGSGSSGGIGTIQTVTVGVAGEISVAAAAEGIAGGGIGPHFLTATSDKYFTVNLAELNGMAEGKSLQILRCTCEVIFC